MRALKDRMRSNSLVFEFIRKSTNKLSLCEVRLLLGHPDDGPLRAITYQ